MKNNENKLTVAVVIPMYNSNNTIQRALLSLEKQTVKPTKVIIVDDGSIDESVKTVNVYITSSCLNIHLVSQKNAGPSAARNKGISLSSEKLVCFLDADDEWNENKLEEQLATYVEKSKSHDVGLVETFTIDSCEDKKIKRDTPLLAGKHFKDFLYANVIKGTASVMIPLEILNEFGGFDESLHYAEDRLLWSQIAKKYDVFTVQKYLVTRHFGTEGNITSSPEKYYVYKKEFITKFININSDILTEQEKISFSLSNIYEFLTAFYTNKSYKWVVLCYRDMLRVSSTAVYYNRGYASLKALISLVKSLLKV